MAEKADYFDWFTKTMAVNVARMHNKNWVHGYLTPHNITLDARIVDLDSVETMSEVKQRVRAGEDTNKSFNEDIKNFMSVIEELKRALGLEITHNIRPGVR